MAITWSILENAAMKKTRSKTTSGISSGVRVKANFFCSAMRTDQRMAPVIVANIRSVYLLNSKNSEVTGRKNNGAEAATSSVRKNIAVYENLITFSFTK